MSRSVPIFVSDTLRRPATPAQTSERTTAVGLMFGSRKDARGAGAGYRRRVRVRLEGDGHAANADDTACRGESASADLQ